MAKHYSYNKKEYRGKQHLIHLGKKHSVETKLKIGLSKLGNKNMLGKHPSKETKLKISLALKGKVGYWKGKCHKHSEESKQKIRGDKNPAERLEVRAKISQALKGKPSGMKGKNHSKETKKIISEHHKKMIKEGLFNPLSNQHKYPNKPELKFIQICNQFNLPFKYVGDGKFWIEGINPDFVNCNGQKICVEIWGDYWHNRPDERLKDIKKLEILNKYGWKRIEIWEHELDNIELIRQKMILCIL